MGIRKIRGGVCAAKGFRAAGVPARIKYEGRNDVALVVADAPCAAAAFMPASRRSIGRRRPMTPVEATSTWRGSIPSSPAVASAASSASR